MNENKAKYEEYSLTDYQIDKELEGFMNEYYKLSKLSSSAKREADKDYYRIAANKMDTERIAFLTAQMKNREGKLKQWNDILEQLSVIREDPDTFEGISMDDEELPMSPDEIEQERQSCENGGDMSDEDIEKHLKDLGEGYQ